MAYLKRTQPLCVISVLSVHEQPTLNCHGPQLVSYPAYFSHAEGKNSLVNGYSVFVPCGLKIGDATSLKMYYVTSHKS